MSHEGPFPAPRESSRHAAGQTPSTTDGRDPRRDEQPGRTPRTALVTAGPTEEPIDEVRFVGNRSSGQMGIAIAEALAERGLEVELALGPTRVQEPNHPRIRVVRFRTSRDLERLLCDRLPAAELVVMAAAVADYRPREIAPGKVRRSAAGLTLELEGVPDLLASTRASRRPGARVVGFALEPRERLAPSALDKMTRKDLDAIVANPLETMDAADIDGTLFLRDGTARTPGGPRPKRAFAAWLADTLLGVFT